LSKYIVVDAANLFFRCIHGAQGDAYSKAGLALHIILRSIKKLWREQKADHIVFALESKSWRYEIFPKYKAHRKVAAQLKSVREQEDDMVYRETLDEFNNFLKTKTNTTVLQCDRAEGDDFIARWTQVHPDDEHIIVSSDTDFIQLLADNVSIYDGVKDIMIKPDGVFNADGAPLKFTVKSDGKLKIGEEVDMVNGDFEVEPEWWRRALFMKCMRGDSGDGIFSAYPKVRETKLKAAWEDRIERGYNWNNLMLQTWDDAGQEAKVQDRYEFNRELIDLTRQPQDVKDIMDQAIVEAVSQPSKTGVGIHFLRFCEKNGLVNVSKEAKDHTGYLNAPYAK